MTDSIDSISDPFVDACTVVIFELFPEASLYWTLPIIVPRIEELSVCLPDKTVPENEKLFTPLPSGPSVTI